MSKERRQLRDQERRLAVRATAETFRPPVARGRKLEGDADLSQLPAEEVVRLTNDEGEVLFLVGYDQLDGDAVLG